MSNGVLILTLLMPFFAVSALAEGWGSSGGGGNGIICFTKGELGEKIASEIKQSQDPTQIHSELKIPRKYLKHIDTIEVREMVEMKAMAKQPGLAGFEFLKYNLYTAIDQQFKYRIGDQVIVPDLARVDRVLVNALAVIDFASAAVKMRRGYADQKIIDIDPHKNPIDPRAKFVAVDNFLVSLRTLVGQVNLKMNESLLASQKHGFRDAVYLPYVKDIGGRSVLNLLGDEDRKRCIVATLAHQKWRGNSPNFEMVHAVYRHDKHSAASQTLTLLHEGVYSYLRRMVPKNVRLTDPAGDVRKIVHILSQNNLDINKLHQMLVELKVEGPVLLANH